MAYQAHTLITFGGKLQEAGSEEEIWQCGIRGFNTGGGPVPPGALDALALAVLRGPTGSGGGLEGMWTQANGHIAVGSTLEWCKAANIAPDGTYSAEPGTADGISVAGTASPAGPAFCSVAISWETGRSLGLARNGRIYPPNFGAQIQFGSRITAAHQTDIGHWAQDLMHTIDHQDSDEGYDFNPYVVSKAGVSNPISGIRVGNIYDVQRRRKDAVPETYAHFDLTGNSGA